MEKDLHKRLEQDRRLAHADSLPKELVELETEFTDEWLKDHDFTPTFADAIGWMRDKQRAELIGKACEWLEKYMESLGYIDEWCRNGEDTFRKAMTDKTNPLFEQCLANVNPDTRAEVRRNMELTWHKASEELPPVDTEVVCKMKGVPHIEHFVCKWDGKYWWRWNDCGRNIKGWFGLNEGWKVIEWKEI